MATVASSSRPATKKKVSRVWWAVHQWVERPIRDYVFGMWRGMGRWRWLSCVLILIGLALLPILILQAY